MKIIVNGEERELDVEADMPLLWALRDELKEYGVKFGCGIAQCGACTVHLNGTAVRSCSIPAAACANQKVDTLEGLGTPESLHAVQEAWIENQVAQCGYCQPGQMLAAASFLAQNTSPTDQDIEQMMSANICRCGTYSRIKEAVKVAAQKLREAK